VFGGAPWGAVSFGFRFHFGKSGIKAPFRRIDALQLLCFRRLLKAPSLAAVFALDPYIVRWANNPKVTYTPDPSSLPPSRDRRECRQSLGLPEDVPILLVYGAIDRRKCLDLLLPAVAAIDRKHNVTLVIAGIQDQRLRNTLLQEPAAAQLRRESRLFEFNRFLTPGEEQSLFASADIVWTYYADTYGSSGVLVKAGQYAKPAIANDAGLVGKIVSDERCGLVVSRPEPDAVARAIVELVTQPATATEMGNRAFARFSGNTPEAFAGPICAVIEAAGRSIQDA
jgi:glycosyltransferase involved in cell wall biosynthesis